MPKEPAKDGFAEFVLEQLAPLGEVSAKSMMGGKTLYCDGTVFALIARGALYLKADDGNRAAFEEQGWPAFQPDEEKPGTMSYYLVPAGILEGQEELAKWAAEALAAGKRAAGKKRKKSAEAS